MPVLMMSTCKHCTNVELVGGATKIRFDHTVAESTTMTLDCLEARFMHDLPTTQPSRGISFQVLCWTVKVIG